MLRRGLRCEDFILNLVVNVCNDEVLGLDGNYGRKYGKIHNEMRDMLKRKLLK